MLGQDFSKLYKLHNIKKQKKKKYQYTVKILAENISLHLVKLCLEVILLLHYFKE